MILAYLLLAIMIILWSFNFIMVSFAVGYVPVLSLSLYRFVIASLSFLILDIFTRRSNKPLNELKVVSHKISKNNWILIIFASFIGQSFYFVTLYGAVALIGPSLPALIVCLLSPVIIAVFALLFFDEHLNKTMIIGFIIATVGGILLVTGGDPSNLAVDSPNFLGYFFAILTPFQWAIYTTLTKKINKTCSTLSTLKYTTYLGTIELFLFVLIMGELPIFIMNILNPVVLLVALYIGFVCHAVGYYIYQYSLKELKSSKVASFLYIEPFITLLFSFLFQINETIVLWNILGGVIVLLAVLLINKEEKTVICVQINE
ncbi:MAG: EamA family transporter [Candidatus Lokiarchaeota archaeon]|nr:EamA family transporter [Candidatus Lokiarchaeota archaeon]